MPASKKTSRTSTRKTTSKTSTRKVKNKKMKKVSGGHDGFPW